MVDWEDSSFIPSVPMTPLRFLSLSASFVPCRKLVELFGSSLAVRYSVLSLTAVATGEKRSIWPNTCRWVLESNATVGSNTLLEDTISSRLGADVDSSGFFLAATLEALLDNEDDVAKRASELA